MHRIFLLLFVFGVLALLITKAGGFGSQANFLEFLPIGEKNRNLKMPDLVPTEPFQIYINTAGGKKALRFSTTFFNQGKAALELYGHTDREKKITYATQYVYEQDGPGLYRDIGQFIYHENHTHWHLDQYVFYQLWSLNGEGNTDKLLMTTDKMSFCIWDEDPHDLNRENAAKSRAYARTCNGRQQGMSVGWSDTYDASIEGQELDISGLSDGMYIFRTSLNPDKKILESDYGNNDIDVKIEIKGNTITRR
jgi:hypothetical protein